MLFSGCCAVREEPAVCAWKRRSSELGSLAWKRSRMILAHRRRAARYLAISSSKSLCALKKKESCGDRKSTRLNSSHSQISYAVFCLKKKKTSAYRLVPVHHIYPSSSKRLWGVISTNACTLSWPRPSSDHRQFFCRPLQLRPHTLPH